MILDIKDVSVRYKNAAKNALSNVSLSVPENSIISIVGHNGAGKSTLINAIMKNISYDGRITYGFPEKELYKWVRVQSQTSTFESKAKVKDILQLYIEILGGEQTVDSLLDSVEMSPFKNSYVEKLSGGEKQKIAVLLATIGTPKLIVLDELTTGLDTMARRMIWDLLNKIRRERNVAILLTSHFLDEVEYLSDQVVVIEHGEVKLTGSPAEIISDAFAGRKQASCLVDTAFRFSGLKFPYTQQDNKVFIEYREDQEREVFDNLKICGGFDVQMKQRTFEDAFLKIVGYQLNEQGEAK